jgi:hypothetical protein
MEKFPIHFCLVYNQKWWMRQKLKKNRMFFIF